MNAIPRKIGKYEITRILGRGGMGVVYVAEDSIIGRKVAIKTLTRGVADDPDLLARFYDEGRKTGRLKHPNIVTVYDLGEDNGSPYIVMELVEGTGLDKLAASGKLALLDNLKIIEQVCAGLDYAHGLGVVHRDIKPANVIVQPDGVAKILDFGIAQMRSERAQITRTGQIIGTPNYISPERLRDLPYDGRDDIFATGVMLYELISGHLPFSGEPAALFYKILHEPHPKLSTWLSDYPPELDSIFDRALAKDPLQRYATADEFSADLHQLRYKLESAQVSELMDQAGELVRQKEFARARDVLLNILRVDPQREQARQILDVVRGQAANVERRSQVDQLLSAAGEAVALGNYQEAARVLDAASAMDPENERVRMRRLEIADANRKQEQLLGELSDRARRAFENDAFEEGLEIVNEGLALDASNSRLLKLRVLIEQGREQKARKDPFPPPLGSVRRFAPPPPAPSAPGSEPPPTPATQTGSFTQYVQPEAAPANPYRTIVTPNSFPTGDPSELLSPGVTQLGARPSPTGFFGQTLVSRMRLLEGDQVGFARVQETLSFYRDHLNRDYQALSQQAKVTYYLWVASVVLGLLVLVSAVVLFFLKQFPAGSVTTISTVLVFFIQKVFQQREDHYRELAADKQRFLEYGNHWLLVIQSIETISNAHEREFRQSELVSVLTRKLDSAEGERGTPARRPALKAKKQKTASPTA